MIRRRTQAVYVISVAAELAGMHPQTLRIYERRGLVMPARTQGGNRRYSDADIEVLRRISELAEEGMNLEGIRRVMELEAENERLRAELDEARTAARAAPPASAASRGPRAAAPGDGRVRRAPRVPPRPRRPEPRPTPDPSFAATEVPAAPSGTEPSEVKRRRRSCGGSSGTPGR